MCCINLCVHLLGIFEKLSTGMHGTEKFKFRAFCLYTFRGIQMMGKAQESYGPKLNILSTYKFISS